MDIPTTYYGRMNGNIYGDNIGVYMTGEAFTRIAEKHDKKIDKLFEDSKNKFITLAMDEIKKLVKLVEKLTDKIEKLDKDIKYASSKREKQEGDRLEHPGDGECGSPKKGSDSSELKPSKKIRCENTKEKE